MSEANARLTAEIEDHRATAAQLRPAQKLDAIGRLTAGISHDFNNILTAITGSVQLAIARAGDEQLPGQIPDIIRSAAERGATLTQRLLAFGRVQRLEARALDVNDVLRDMKSLLAATVGGLAEVRSRSATRPLLRWLTARNWNMPLSISSSMHGTQCRAAALLR